MSIYEVRLARGVEKFFKKKAHKALAREVDRVHMPKLRANPYTAGSRLTGNARDTWSYHFHFSGTQYRMAYHIIKNALVIFIIDIGKREHFYQKLF